MVKSPFDWQRRGARSGEVWTKEVVWRETRCLREEERRERKKRQVGLESLGGIRTSPSTFFPPPLADCSNVKTSPRIEPSLASDREQMPKLQGGPGAVARKPQARHRIVSAWPGPSWLSYHQIFLLGRTSGRNANVFPRRACPGPAPARDCGPDGA